MSKRPNGEAGPPVPVLFDQTYDGGAQRDWPDQDLFEPNAPPRPGYNLPENPPAGPPPEPYEYAVPDGVLPPPDPFQAQYGLPPPMPLPVRHRYVSPHGLPTWNAGSVGAVSLPVVGESGPMSPLLAALAGGAVGYVLGGWKGCAGGALAVVGANNLGLVASGDRPWLRVGAAALGLGIGGWLVYSSAKKLPLVPNPPAWLARVRG